jgi:hypothetical protein
VPVPCGGAGTGTAGRRRFSSRWRLSNRGVASGCQLKREKARREEGASRVPRPIVLRSPDSHPGVPLVSEMRCDAMRCAG